VTLTPDSLLPFNRCDFAKGLYDCDARVVHEQIQRIPSNVMDEIGNTGWHGKVMNQADHMRAVVLHCLAHFR
jgi:hypothetical protein